MSGELELDTVLGLREGPDVELESAGSLKKLDTIGRAVVAMLNTRGGTVWIGVTERDERATGVENIEGVAAQIRRIEDHLMDTIEPPPSTEVSVGSERVASSDVIAVRVEEGSRKPYAQVKDGAWRYFPVRAGARTRVMTRSELIDAFGRATSDDDGVRQSFDDAWNGELASRRSGLWVRIAASGVHRLDDDDRWIELLNELLRSPGRTGNRRMGWNFCTDYEQFRRSRAGYQAGGPDAYTWTEVSEDGVITFRAPLDRLERLEPEAADEISPYALVEYPVSITRLAATVYAEAGVGPREHVYADAGLIDIDGKKLRPGMPQSIAYQLEARSPEADELRAGLRESTVSELQASPDKLGWDLVRVLYSGFGLRSKEMPTQLFDEESGIIAFPP